MIHYQVKYFGIKLLAQTFFEWVNNLEVVFFDRVKFVHMSLFMFKLLKKQQN